VRIVVSATARKRYVRVFLRKILSCMGTSHVEILTPGLNASAFFPQYTKLTKMNNTELLRNPGGKASAYPEVSPTPIAV